MRTRTLTCLTLASALTLSACSKQEQAAYNVEEVPLAQISADLAAGKTTSVAVTKAYIARIGAYDSALHAVIKMAPDALDQAAASDKRRKDGHPLSPLDGVPVMFKDNIDAAGLATTAGSYALADNVAIKDSEVVRRMRAAGVIMLGKANLSQWAGLRTTKGFNGSTTGGSPRNPYDLTRSPAGSSSGPGIIAATSMAAGAVGSDTTGSIIGPSNSNGVVGLRPTVGLISRTGVVPISSTLDTTGPMARTVKDAAMMLTAMAGSDPSDPATQEADAHKTDYAKGLAADALKDKRIGVIRAFGGYSETTQPAFDAALEVLKAQGAELVEIPSDTFTDLGWELRVIEAYDFKPDLEAYLKNAPVTVKSRTLADIIAFNKQDEHEKVHSDDRQDEAQALSRDSDPEYAKMVATARKRAGDDGYGKAMKDNDVSALVFLSGGPAGTISPDESSPQRPLFPHQAGEPGRPSGSNLSAASGYPDLVVPAGFINGLPVTISFIGPRWSEAMLLDYGYAYEQASHARKPPEAYKKTSAGQ